MRLTQCLPFFFIAAVLTSNACQVLQEDKPVLAEMISDYWNAIEHESNGEQSNALNNWYLQYASDDINVHLMSPTGEHTWESRHAVIQPETGHFDAFAPYHIGETVVFTLGGNVEYTCLEEENEREIISVLAPVHGANHFEGGQAVIDMLVQYDWMYEERWLCVKIDFLLMLREMPELVGQVSLMERAAVLDQIIALYASHERAINSRNASIFNNWIIGNALEELQIIWTNEGFEWNTREEVIDESTGLYAMACAPFHHTTTIVSLGANIRYSCDTMDGMRVVSAKLPVRYAFTSDEASASDDELVLVEFVQVQGLWRMKKLTALVHDMQVSVGSVPEVMQ